MSAEPAVAAEPASDQLATAVRRGLGLPADAPVSMREVGELSNINYVYRVEVPGRTFYLKVVPEVPKRLPIRLPRERVFSEAEGLRRFRALGGHDVVIPEVLFVDGEEMAVAMSDVGEGRDILFNVITSDLDPLVEQAAALGRALANVHRGTRGNGSPRPPLEEAIIRKVVFDGLLAPGAKQTFPELATDVLLEMQMHDECLIHADLWSKNLLVKRGAPVAIVDFEGVLYGDPAFDLGTLTAVALVPALDRVELIDDALTFASLLLQAWTGTCGSLEWAEDVMRRTFHATATFLAARGFGPFAYALTADGKARIGELARSLAADPPTQFHEFAARVRARR